MTKRTTIFDVAAAADVSIKTVSRVLNGEPNVRAITAERVHAAAAKLQYSPNLSAKRLASNRSFLIGLVYDNPSGHNSFIPDVQEGALAACGKRNYELVIHPADADATDSAQQLNSFAEKLHIDGLILLPPFSDDAALLKSLSNKGIPFARISQSFPTRFTPCVSVADEAAAFGVTEYLIGLGHQRIAFIKGNPTHGASRDRFHGYQRALNEHDIRPLKSLIKDGDFSFESGQRAGRALLRLKQPPTAIFASNDDMAAGVLVAAHKLNIAVPEQLSICGYDDISITEQTWPTLTSVRQPIKEIAELATQLFIEQLGSKDTAANKHLELAAKLVVRDSTAAPGVGAGTPSGARSTAR